MADASKGLLGALALAMALGAGRDPHNPDMQSIALDGTLPPELLNGLADKLGATKRLILDMTGGGSYQSFMEAIMKQMKYGEDKARALGLSEFTIQIDGSITVKLAEVSTKPDPEKNPIPTLEDISRAMLQRRFELITDTSPWEGLEGVGYLWQPPGYSVVADVVGTATRFDIYNDDGDLLAQGDYLNGIANV